MTETWARGRAFVLLRYLLVIGMAYLLLAEEQFAVPSAATCILLALALASNVAANHLPSRILESRYFTRAVLLIDAVWTTGVLLYSGHFAADFFYIYFFVLLLAAIGESLALIALGAGVVCTSYAYVLAAGGGPGALWQSPSLIRIPFLFITAAFYGYLVEVTRQEEKRTEAACALAREKAATLATVSHELRTPVGAIMGWTELLIECGLTGPERDYAEAAYRSSHRLLTLINDILDVSKLDAGKLELETVPFALHEVVEDVGALLAESAHRKGLELVCDVSRRVPATVHGDPKRLGRIITNLVSNAIKFTERGEVVVRVDIRSQTAEHVLLHCEVADTGIGLSAEQQARLFLPFAQAEKSTARQYGGTGLGLAISKGLVAVMGGEIGAVSRPEMGSTFWFTARLGKGLAGPEASQDRRGDLRGLRVLVIDESATSRAVLEKQLRAWGMHPDTTANGPQGVEQLRARQEAGVPYDMAIVDMQMPGMHGLDIIGEIRHDVTQHTFPVVLLTAVHDRDTRDGVGPVVCAVRLPKPVRISRLYEALCQLKDASRLERGRPGVASARIGEAAARAAAS